MQISEERIALLRAYCRIDADDDQFALLAPGMMESAKEYMNNAGVREPEPGSPRRALYDDCINALVLDDYDNRGTKVKYAQLSDNKAFQNKKNQLKWTEPPYVPNSDTGGGDGA